MLRKFKMRGMHLEGGKRAGELLSENCRVERIQFLKKLHFKVCLTHIL